MNRTARLVGITEQLRLAGDTGRTADWLADRFEVSARTIKRDMLALQDAGLPIWSATGPGGGYRILSREAHPLPPIEFTQAEATAVAVALMAAGTLPFALEGQAALTKIQRSMPAATRQSAEQLASRIWLRAPATRRAPAARVVDEAVRTGRVVLIDYQDAGGKVTRARPLEPMFFAADGPDWYLFAWCRHRQAGRTFRLDRITRAVLTAEPAPARDVADVFTDIPSDAIRLQLDG